MIPYSILVLEEILVCFTYVENCIWTAEFKSLSLRLIEYVFFFIFSRINSL